MTTTADPQITQIAQIANSNNSEETADKRG